MFRRCISSVTMAVAAVCVAGSALAGPQVVMPDEFSAENRALIDATVAFFDEVEARPAPRKRVPVFTAPLSATKSKASADDAAVLTRMGPVGHLTVYRTTWYPVDRLLGTVDFMGTWDGNRNLVCGYLTWDLSDPDAPRLEALTASFVDLDDLKYAGDIQIHRSLMEANCAFGAIDENYHVFDVTG